MRSRSRSPTAPGNTWVIPEPECSFSSVTRPAPARLLNTARSRWSSYRSTAADFGSFTATRRHARDRPRLGFPEGGQAVWIVGWGRLLARLKQDGQAAHVAVDLADEPPGVQRVQALVPGRDVVASGGIRLVVGEVGDDVN